MGQKLLDQYNTYVVQNFTDSEIREFVFSVLQSADDINSEMPASATGKYHPIADQGAGGSYRHSIMVTEVCKILIRSLPEYDGVKERETILAACLLHDICKYKFKENKKRIRTQFEHPTMGAALIKEVGERVGKIPLSVAIAELVMTHHSRWNTNGIYSPGVELPLPRTLAQRIVSFSDLIAANAELPELMIKFREDAIKEVFKR